MNVSKDNSIKRLVLASMMICLTFIATYIIRIPVPATQGYISLGDLVIILSMFLIGWKWGGAAGALGAALADLMGGFSIFAPVSLVVKFGMVFIMGIFIEKAVKKHLSFAKFTTLEIVGMVLGCIFSLAGYYFAEVIIYGNWITPLIEVPLNIIQFATGAVLAVLLTIQLEKTSAYRLFEYKIPVMRKSD